MDGGRERERGNKFDNGGTSVEATSSIETGVNNEVGIAGFVFFPYCAAILLLVAVESPGSAGCRWDCVIWT